MTRFTRVKSTHQRIEGDSTSWKELKDTPAKDDKKNHRDSSKSKGKAGDKSPRKGIRRFDIGGRGGDNVGTGNKNQFSKNKRPEQRRKRNEERDRGDESANFTPLGGSNPNVRGHGQTKSVKIFGNFWVGEEDARRLQGMAKKLQKEGVSRKEILKALQGERRKAEKASKRRRDKTCYNCRQFGHVLADCPGQNKGEEGQEEGGVNVNDGVRQSDGDICFKCGSTEHTSRFCKRKSDKFQFAKCFLCSQSGHIARQCPTNKKGIYPSGGSCDECGSVNHLKRDCPDAVGNEDMIGDDPDAQVERVSNPFVSTEYEEIPEPVEEPTADEYDKSEEKAEEKAVKTPKKPLKRKIPEIDDKNCESEKFKNSSSSNKNVVQQKLAAPKKRRVKF